MFVEVNQMTGIPVSDKTILAGQETAQKLATLSADDLQITAQELGFKKTKFVVAEMLHGLLPEEMVAVTMDSLQAEYDRLMVARNVVPQGTPFLEN